MRKYILLTGGLAILLMAGVTLYMSYAPRVGPIGNGPNDRLIWMLVIPQLFSGLCFIALGIIQFRHERKTK